MKWTTINVSSVTNAMRGKSVLERNGITAHIQRAADARDNNGCGYRLLVGSDEEHARSILSNAGIALRDGGTR